MSNELVVKVLSQWVSKVGKANVSVALILRGVSTTNCYKLVNGKYNRTPNNMLSQIIREEAIKAGIPIEEAS